MTTSTTAAKLALHNNSTPCTESHCMLDFPDFQVMYDQNYILFCHILPMIVHCTVLAGERLYHQIFRKLPLMV